MTTRSGKTCLRMIVGMVVVSALCVATAAQAATRVALVGDDRQVAVANLVTLAQVKLTNDANIELLERDEIRRVLDEQKLSASGLVDVDQIIATGILLKADLFAVIESSPGNDAIPSIVVFDARTGVRYWDAALPALSQLEQAADEAASAVQSAVQKKARANKGLRTVGFVTVRNADLPRDQDALCDTIGFLIERGLPRSPDVAVLERQRLAKVNEERLLPGADDPTGLLSSLSLIDLEISRAGRGLQATAIVRHAGNDQSERIAVSVVEMNAASLADALAEKLIVLMQAAPAAGKADHRLEAKRFDTEAAHHYNHQRFIQAIRAEQASHALEPGNQDYSERLALYLVRYATYLFSPNQMTVTKGGDNAWMDQVLKPETIQTLLAAAHDSLQLNQSVTRPSAHHPPYNMALAMLCDRLRGLQKSSQPPVQAQVDEWLELCRRRSQDYCESWAKKTEADPKWHDAYTSSVHGEVALLKSASVDTAQYAGSLLQVASRWVAVTKNIQPQSIKSDGAELLSMWLRTLVAPKTWPWPAEEREFARRMAPLHQAMQQHGRPIIRLYGHFGQIRGDILLNDDAEQDAYQRFDKVFRPQAEAIINTPAPWNPANSRFAAYEAWRTAIEEMPGKGRREFVQRELVELCHFMIGRNELSYKTLQRAFWELDRRTSLDLIKQVLALVDSPSFQETESEKARLRSLLRTTEQNILAAQPDLATSAPALPWSKATRVFELVAMKELSDLVACVSSSERLYGFCLELEQDRSALRMIRLSRSGEKPELLAKIDLGLAASSLPSHLRSKFISATCVYEESIYLATNGAGIVVFPPGNATPRRIDLTDGLPSRNVRSLAIMADKLYAGFNEGYLIAYDLKTHQSEVLASSRRKQKQSPFDDSDVFRVPVLVADEARQRIVFVIGQQLWQLTPSDGKITPVLDLLAVATGRSEPKLTGQTIAGCTRRGDKLLISDAFRMMELDLAQDRGAELHTPEFGVFPTYPPHVVVKGWLWSGSSFSRLSLDKREFQSLPHPGTDSTPFRPTVHLNLTTDGRQLIAADSHSVWVLELQ